MDRVIATDARQAPVGFVIIGAHPHGDGIVSSYRQKFHAVAEPSDEATVLRLRLQRSQMGHAASRATTSLSGPAGGGLVDSPLCSGQLIREPGTAGAWWRCMSKVVQEFPSPDGKQTVPVAALVLQEVVPDRVLHGDELRLALANVQGGVVVLLGGGGEALVRSMLAAGAAAVLVPRGGASESRADESVLGASAEALMRTIELVRSGRSLDHAITDAGCNVYFTLITKVAFN